MSKRLSPLAIKAFEEGKRKTGSTFRWFAEGGIFERQPIVWIGKERGTSPG
jgi:hypothetical protein